MAILRLKYGNTTLASLTLMALTYHRVMEGLIVADGSVSAQLAHWFERNVIPGRAAFGQGSEQSGTALTLSITLETEALDFLDNTNMVVLRNVTLELLEST